MNILQIAQLIGPMTFGDVDGGSKLVRIMEPTFPENFYIDITTTGDKFLKLYSELDIEGKKAVTSIVLTDYPDLIIELLDDLVHITTQRELVQKYEKRAKHNQITIIAIIFTLIATWTVYSYHYYSHTVTGKTSSSSLIAFADVLADFIFPSSKNETQATPTTGGDKEPEEEIQIPVDETNAE